MKKAKRRSNYAFSISQNLDYHMLRKVLSLKDNMKYLGTGLNKKLTLKALKK